MGNQQRRVEAHERHLKALELRKQGLSYEKIAQIVGWTSWRTAHNAVKRALDRLSNDSAQELRELEVARMDDILDKLWPRRGEVGAIDRILKIMERRARLLGLDSPTAIDMQAGISVVVDWGDNGGDTDSS